MKLHKMLIRGALVIAMLFGFVGVAHAQTLSPAQSGGSVQVTTAIASSITASCNTGSVAVAYVSNGIGTAPAFTCTASYNLAAGSAPNYGVVTDLYFTTAYALTGSGGNIPLSAFLLSIDGGTAAPCNQTVADTWGNTLPDAGQSCSTGDNLHYNPSVNGDHAPLTWSASHSYVAEINFGGLGSMGVGNYSGILNFEMYFTN